MMQRPTNSSNNNNKDKKSLDWYAKTVRMVDRLCCFGYSADQVHTEMTTQQQHDALFDQDNVLSRWMDENGYYNSPRQPPQTVYEEDEDMHDDDEQDSSYTRGHGTRRQQYVTGGGTSTDATLVYPYPADKMCYSPARSGHTGTIRPHPISPDSTISQSSAPTMQSKRPTHHSNTFTHVDRGRGAPQAPPHAPPAAHGSKLERAASHNSLGTMGSVERRQTRSLHNHCNDDDNMTQEMPKWMTREDNASITSSSYTRRETGGGGDNGSMSSRSTCSVGTNDSRLRQRQQHHHHHHLYQQQQQRQHHCYQQQQHQQPRQQHVYRRQHSYHHAGYNETTHQNTEQEEEEEEGMMNIPLSPPPQMRTVHSQSLPDLPYFSQTEGIEC